MNRSPQFILGLAFFALMFLLAGVSGYQNVVTVRSSPGFRATQKGERVVVESIREGGPAAALRPGDEIVALDGNKVEHIFQLDSAFRNTPPGYRYTLLVRRGGQTLETALRTGEVSPLSRMNLYTQQLFIPAIFLITGLAVFLLRQGDKQALLLALMFGTMPGMFLQAYFHHLPPWMNALLWLGAMMTALLPPLFLHFFLVFPEERNRVSPMLRRFPRLERWLYLPHALLVLPMMLATGVMIILSPARALNFGQAFYWETITFGLDATFFLAGLLSLLINYRQSSRASRRKLRVVVAGSLLGLVPFLLLFGMLIISGAPPVSTSTYRFIVSVVTFTFPLFPLSFAYAIIRHRVIPVSFIVRRGVRYLFVSQGSLALEIVAVALAVNLLLWVILKYLATMDMRVVGILSAVDAILVWNITSELHRRVIAPAIDRRFFRQAYNAQHVLAELGNSLRPLTDRRKMTALATVKIQAALHPEHVVIFLRDEATGNYVCASATWQHEDSWRSGPHETERAGAPDASLILPKDSYIVSRFRESSQPLMMDLDDVNSWAHALVSPNASSSPARQIEGETLGRLRPVLLLPISTRDQLLGVMSLGRRLGDWPFSREDRQLLASVAMQIAMAVENAQLVKQKVEEEQLRRELSMANEVQQRLFPKCAPEMTSLELCGVCRPARGVAGDYYDFIQLDPGRVGIAVADVAGKGIAAALLMSTVQASLRSQAPVASGDPTELVSVMNRLLYSSTDTSSYATFFYAQFDELTRRLCYVNAGHNPPILFRRAAAASGGERGLLHRASSDSYATTAQLDLEAGTMEILNLTTGGPVIGLLEDCVYDCETVPLEGGDILIAYTDGVTEAFNPQGEEFGEERLRQVIVENAGLSAGELSEQVMRAIADWCREAPQYDDQTLVVMRVR
ncbi:MAG TPA: SpoIIE family protein phosphatase [Blastocatellia bacterium]|nr:SpoIIE family protein phosphatase [Blastocatellia bacterium]